MNDTILMVEFITSRLVVALVSTGSVCNARGYIRTPTHRHSPPWPRAIKRQRTMPTGALLVQLCGHLVQRVTFALVCGQILTYQHRHVLEQAFNRLPRVVVGPETLPAHL